MTITGNDAVFTGTTTLSGQGRGDVVTKSVLNLNGVTKADMFANATVTGFDEISAGAGTDAIIANATVLDGRSAFTKSGTGKLTLSSSAGFANALTVPGRTQLRARRRSGLRQFHHDGSRGPSYLCG